MKKYIVEFIGTFFLVLTVGLMVAPGNSNVLLAPLAIGAILMVMVYAGGHISGANYNPAVSLALFIRKKLSAQDMVIYMVCQLAAGALAATVVQAMGVGLPPNPSPAPDVVSSILKEFIFTFALAYVVLNVATSTKLAGNDFYGLAIGFTVCAAAYAGGQTYNPAVGLGLALLHLYDFASIWIAFVGPLAGGAFAALVFRLLNPEEFFPAQQQH